MPEFNIELIVGTYEEFLLGYIVQIADGEFSLVQSFANHSHKASIRCVTSHETLLASGGADDAIHLYNLRTRKEAGVLVHHNGTVTCLQFTPDKSYLVSGGDDGLLAICKTGNWQLEKLWGSAHKGSGVIDISIHPSGKLALSVGADATLRTWNLVKGRQAYATRLGSAKCGGGWQITKVLWSPGGNLYAVAVASKVDVYNVNEARIIYSIVSDKKVTDICFISDNELCVGNEKGKIYLHDLEKQCLVKHIEAHTERVKCLQCICFNGDIFVASASSSGVIKLWKYENFSLQEMCSANAGCRITCLTATTCGFISEVKNESDDSELDTTIQLDDSTSSGKNNRKRLRADDEVVIENEEEAAKSEQNSKKHDEISKKKKQKRRKDKFEDIQTQLINKPNISKKMVKRKELFSCADTKKSLKQISKKHIKVKQLRK